MNLFQEYKTAERQNKNVNTWSRILIIQNNWRKCLYVNSTQCIMQNSKLLATIVKSPETWNAVSLVAYGCSMFYQSLTTEMSETLVSRLRLRPGWSQGRSQALRPPAKSLSISLKIWDWFQKSQYQSQILRPQCKSLSLSLKMQWMVSLITDFETLRES